MGVGEGARGEGAVEGLRGGAGLVGQGVGVEALDDHEAVRLRRDGLAQRRRVGERDGEAAAAALGLEVVDDGTDASWWCKERWVHGPRDRGADVVFQCRGRAAVLHEALRALRPQGVVIDLAFYTEGAADLRLGEEFHHNGLTVRCAQISRVPRGLSGTWDRDRLAGETAALLLAEGPAVREHVVTDVVPVQQGPDVVLELVRRERQALQIVLDFTAGAADQPNGRG